MARWMIQQEESVEKLHADLSKALAEQPRRFLVVIDDIDRLSPDEAQERGRHPRCSRARHHLHHDLALGAPSVCVGQRLVRVLKREDFVDNGANGA